MSETKRLLYVIHAAQDHELVKFLHDEIEAQIPSWRVFAASKAGQIPTGSEWLNQIHDNLRIAASYLLLLTPSSIRRSWVWYEAGAAWRSNNDRFPVVAAGLSRDEIDFPLRMVQTLVLDDPDDASQLFTFAPKCFASCTTALPATPDAPLASIFVAARDPF